LACGNQYQEHSPQTITSLYLSEVTVVNLLSLTANT
jgi:hypothetical protein